MHRTWSLAAKLGVIGAVLLVVALASISLTLWVTWQLEGGAAAVNETGRMRMQTWRLAQALPGADPQRIETLMTQFDRSVLALQSGDPARPLFVPSDSRTQQAFAEVQRDWRRVRDDWSAPTPAPAQSVALRAEAFVARIDTFVSAIEQQLARLTSLLNAVQFMMLALTLASAVTLLYSAYLFIFNPLTRLQAALAGVERGDLAVRVQADGHDEFAALALGFNRMAQRLQALYDGLESKVREKTSSLQAEHARLAVLYESAAFVARAGSLDELARGPRIMGMSG